MKRKNFSKLRLKKVTVINHAQQTKGGQATQLNTCWYTCYCTVGVSCGCDTYFCQSLYNPCETITDGNMCNY